MSLEAVVHRASRDSAFRQTLLSDPAGTLAGYDLTSEEKAALRSIRSYLARTSGDQTVSTDGTWM